MRDPQLKAFSDKVKKGFVDALGDESSFSKMKHAISWFNNRSIPIHYDKISAELYVIVGDEIHVQVSSSEISYRAELWKSEVLG